MYTDFYVWILSKTFDANLSFEANIYRPAYQSILGPVVSKRVACSTSSCLPVPDARPRLTSGAVKVTRVYDIFTIWNGLLEMFIGRHYDQATKNINYAQHIFSDSKSTRKLLLIEQTISLTASSPKNAHSGIK